MNWAAQLPMVRPALLEQAKHVTLILPYYLNAQFLRRQVSWWRTFPAHVRTHLSAIIVDDGSPIPAAPVLQECLAVDRPFPIRLFRVQVDVPWNWITARNIGFDQCAEGWCLVTDMDHVLPASSAEALVYGAHDPEKVYALSRVEHTGQPIHPHSASFFLTRRMFWKVGGYDERYSGHYGSDGKYRKRLLAAAPVRLLADRLIRHEYDEDSSTMTLARKSPADNEAIARIAATIAPGTQPLTLCFPFEEVPL